MRSVEIGGMLQSLFPFLSPFSLWPHLPRRGLQRKWGLVRIKATKDKCLVFWGGRLGGMWPDLTPRRLSSCTVMLTLAYTQVYTTQWSTHTHSHMFLACFACAHLWPIQTRHIQGSDTYQTPVWGGNSVEPGLFLSPERAQTPHAVVIMYYNRVAHLNWIFVKKRLEKCQTILNECKSSCSYIKTL